MKRWTLLFGILLTTACGAQQNDNDTASSTDNGKEADSMSQEIITMDNGLQYILLQNGDGAAIEPGSTAVVHYTGWLYDESQPDNKGQKFDSSRDRGDAFRFPLGAKRVIRGWDEGVAGMQVGERRLLIIPPEMGYGARGAGAAIPANATLVFDVELLGIE